MITFRVRHLGASACWLMLVAFASLQACRWDYEVSERTSTTAGNSAQSGGSGWNGSHAAGMLSTGAGRPYGSTRPSTATGAMGGATGAMGGATGAMGGATGAMGGATGAMGGATGAMGGATGAIGGATGAIGGATAGGTTAARGGNAGIAGSTTSASAQAGSNGASTLVLQGMNQTALHGGTTTTPYLDVCPGNAVLVGVQGTVSKVGVTLVSSIQGLCGTLISSVDASTITTTTITETPLRGGTGNTWRQLCPADQVVIGLEGTAGACLDSLAIRCGALARQGSSVSVTTASTLPLVGGDGGTPFSDGCGLGQIARALNLIVNDVSWVDAMGLICGVPSISN